MNARRDFGTMPPEWQDRETFRNGENTHIRGFYIVMEDGYEFNHAGGCATIPAALLAEHGAVMKSRELA